MAFTLCSALLLVIFSCANAQNEQQFIKEIEYKCSRDCDSHFTGADCWQKTYSYFTNHLVQSLNQYAHMMNRVNRLSQQNAADLDKILDNTYKKFKQQEDPFASEVVPSLDTIFQETMNMLKSSKLGEINKEMKCPLECSQGWLTSWIILFGIFIALTLGTILFVAAYSMFTKIQYQKLDTKIKSNAANSLAS